MARIGWTGAGLWTDPGRPAEPRTVWSDDHLAALGEAEWGRAEEGGRGVSAHDTYVFLIQRLKGQLLRQYCPEDE